VRPGRHAVFPFAQPAVSVFLASESTPGHIVESGQTRQVFEDPGDPRTADYVHGRFG
jgi:ABC-type phosphate transport system ATPase subunit